MDIKVYTLEKLESHIRDIHSHHDHVSPLSPLRLQSYLKNPRAEQSDPVLLELWMKDKLIAYRSLLPDCFFDYRGKPWRFAWLSGNWVHPDFRRQGFSTKLLQEAEARWDGRLMYTNYAPASKAVYDRTGQFPLLVKREGKRFYLRAASEDLLGDRLGSRGLLRTGDKAINLLHERKLRKFEGVKEDLCLIEKVTNLGGEPGDLVNGLLKSSLFRRDVKVFNWILDYPWVREGSKDASNYHFSYQSARFENILLSFTLPDGNRGIIWLLIHNKALSVPYLFSESDQLLPFMARTLIHQMIIKGFAYATIRHTTLAEQVAQHKNLFLTIRNMPQLIFAHKKIEKQVQRELEIQDGDGDVVFTG